MSFLRAVQYFHASLLYQFISLDCEQPDSPNTSRVGIGNDRETGEFCFHTTKCFPYIESSKISRKPCNFVQPENKKPKNVLKKISSIAFVAQTLFVRYFKVNILLWHYPSLHIIQILKHRNHSALHVIQEGLLQRLHKYLAKSSLL